MTAPDALLGATLGGRYRLGQKLGEGGMGAVYVAENHLGRRFAVKVLLGWAQVKSQSALERFFQEARASAKLTSPHVVRVFEVGVDPARSVPFLVMDLLDGTDVDALLERTGPLDPVTAVRIALQAAKGLTAAHAAGIVHRDVKPANLFLDRRESDEVVVKVCDFGIAKAKDAAGAMTQTGSILGSPLYFSPEQAKDSKRVDARSDVWSLGASLYSMLCGRAPHEAETSVPALLVAVRDTDVPHVQDIAPWIAPDLAIAVHAALFRDADARYSSMEVFAEALAPLAGGSDRLDVAMLRGVSPEVRGHSAARAVLRDTVAAPHATDPLIGTKLGGRYRVMRLLGRGGMGAVYEAEGGLGKRFAVKVMTETVTASDEARRRFVREARAAAAIESDHVVSVLDADTDMTTGMPFLVMDLLEGTDLGGLIENVGAVEPLTVTRLFLQACRGLAAAHAKAIVHRDIKPANIFLDRAHGNVKAKIGDFGVAKSTSTEAINQATAALTKTGGILGSPLYMSPEQARNAKHVDARTDVWSLCLSMYEAYSGQAPWSHCTTIGELILAICTEELEPLAELAPWLDPGLVDVVHRGLTRDPRVRWPDVSTLADALRPFSRGSEGVTPDMLVGVDVPRTSLPRERRAVEETPSAEGASVRMIVGPAGGAPAMSGVPPSIAVIGGQSTVGVSNTHMATPKPRPGRRVAALLGVVAIAGAAALAALRWQEPVASPLMASAESAAAPSASVSQPEPELVPEAEAAPAPSATASATAPASATAIVPTSRPLGGRAASAPVPSAVPSSEPRALQPPAAAPPAPSTPKAPKLQSSW